MNAMEEVSADGGGVVLQGSDRKRRDDMPTTGDDDLMDTAKTDAEAGLQQAEELGCGTETVRGLAGAGTNAQEALSHSVSVNEQCTDADYATRKGMNSGRLRQFQAKVGKLPISRWVVFLFYCCYCLLAGPSFLNWTTIADMLYKADAYIWECQPDTLITPPPKSHEAKCPAQEIAVNNLFSVGSSSYFVFAMLGGIMLDYAGPKLGALLGLACLVLGWLLLAFSSDSFRAYVPAMVFAGAGIDMAFFPCLCGANLFPGYIATIIALFGACRSISFVTGLALRGIFFNIPNISLRGTLIGYVGVGLGYCVCVALFIIPWVAWPPPETKEGERIQGAKTQDKERKMALKVTSGGQRECDDVMKNNSCIQVQRSTTAAGESCTDTQSGPVKDGTDQELLQAHGQSASTDTGAAVCSHRGDAQEMELAVTRHEQEILTRRDGGNEETAQSAGASRRTALLSLLKTSLESFMRDFTSPFFLPLVPYFVFVLIDILFFTPSAKRLIPDAYAANQIITVCGFAPCIVLGYLADRIGIIRVMVICNSTGLLAWVLLLIPQIPCFTAFQYMVSILFTIQMSFLVSQVYCYVTELFPPENLGKLIGFLCSTGGIISLVTSPMRDYSVNNSFYPMVILCLVLAAVNEALLAFMYFWKRRSSKLKQQQLAVAERAHEDILIV